MELEAAATCRLELAELAEIAEEHTVCSAPEQPEPRFARKVSLRPPFRLLLGGATAGFVF